MKRKFLCFFATLFLFCFLILSSCKNATKEYGDEVQIYTVEDLLKIESQDNRRFTLMNDIDCEGKTYTGVQEFMGIFDGNGHTISNINITSTNNCYGFFASVARVGQIKNLALVDFTIEINKASTSSSEEVFAGGLVGYFDVIRDGDAIGTISQCYVEGTINLNVSSKNNYIGGIAGFRDGGKIENNFCATDIINRCEYGLRQKRYFGGFFGVNSGETKYCIYAGSIHDEGANDGIFNTLNFAKTYIGGIAGLSTGNYTSYTSCLATPLYVGSQCSDSSLAISPVVGDYENYCNPTVTECYYTFKYSSDVSYWQKITSTTYGYSTSTKVGNSRINMWTRDFLLGNPREIPDPMYFHYTEHGEEIPIKLDFSEEIWYFTNDLGETENPDYPMPKIFK